MVPVPVGSWLPITVTLAVEVPPEPESAALPSVVEPMLNTTEPVGDAVPVVAFTVAASVVLPVVRMLAGVAVTLVVVDVPCTLTVTVTAPTDPENPPPPG
jgi:hypothetical protein